MPYHYGKTELTLLVQLGPYISFVIETTQNESVDSVMQTIYTRTNIPPQYQRVNHKGTELQPGQGMCLFHYNFEEYSTLLLSDARVKTTDAGTEDERSDSEWRSVILKECPKNTIGYISNCPTIRACPACKMVIEHNGGCNEMVCRCGHKFCFICLQPALNNRLNCGAHDSTSIAAIQC
ncbi:uncharacterized protein LOC100374165 [Saccoglossus kowalevskii]|uniref:RING finger protein YKR017C-like n=1 Tax=Saccoglossus kowalevskii TaxID=10224 RepID=A0ABM0GP06_SACKO|nr:PREDICTED: RING finger protein YKR017C-like [Saccoglossus kowalevskii]